MELRQSTSKTIRFGPFTDTDGIALTSLTITQADMQLSKDGAAYAQKNAAGDATHDTDGFYFTTFNVTDTDTTKNLKLQVNVAGALLVWENYDVVTQSYHDAKYSGTFNNLGGVDQTGDSFPIVDDPVFGNEALNDKLSNIAPGVAGGGAVNASGATIITGTPTLDYTVTHAQDGILHEVAAVAGNTEYEYTVTLGPNELLTEVIWRGFVKSNGDKGLFQLYDWVNTTFITELEVVGNNSDTLLNHPIGVVNSYTGTGADQGKVRFRIISTDATNIATDRIKFESTTNFQSAGYALGRVWVRESGLSGTTPYFNGVVERPCPWSDAVVVAPNVGEGLTDFHIINGTTVQLSGNSDNYSLFGDNWTLQLNGKSINKAYFKGGSVSGIGLSPNGVRFKDFHVGTLSVQKAHFDDSFFAETVTMTLSGDYTYDNGKSDVPGIGGPTFTKTLGQVITAQWRDWKGSITVSNIEATDVMTISGTELGDIVLNGVDGTVKVLGQYETLTDNRTGSPTLVKGAFQGSDVTEILVDTNEIGVAGIGLTQVSLISTGLDAIVSTATGMVEIAKAIWNRQLTGANHNIVNSAGRKVREVVDSVVIFADNAQSSAGLSANQIKLSLGASADDGAYDPAEITILSGTGVGQTRMIYQYEGATRIATLDRNWKTIPNTTSIVAIKSNPGREHVNEGLLQAATSTTVTLNILASAYDNAYTGQMLFLRSGLGADQARLVKGYVGATKVATLDKVWDVTPDITSAYVMLPISPVMLDIDTTATIDAIPSAVENRQEMDSNSVDLSTIITGQTTINNNVLSNFTVIDNLNDLSAAQVNAEVLDVFTVDTFGEVSYPGATPSIVDMIHYTFSKSSNKLTQTGTQQKLRNSTDTGDLGVKAMSDDGTTFIQGKDT